MRGNLASPKKEGKISQKLPKSSPTQKNLDRPRSRSVRDRDIAHRNFALTRRVAFKSDPDPLSTPDRTLAKRSTRGATHHELRPANPHRTSPERACGAVAVARQAPRGGPPRRRRPRSPPAAPNHRRADERSIRCVRAPHTPRRPAAPPRRHVSCEAASKAPSDAAATEPPLRYMCIHQFSSVHSLLPWSIGPTEYAHTQGVGVTKNHTRHASVRPIG